MTSQNTPDDGYDDFLDALSVDDETAQYVECSNGHGSLPPRRVCPVCGSTSLSDKPLPNTGTVVTYTTIHAPTPDFDADAPYTVIIADVGPLKLTAIYDGDRQDVSIGMDISLTVKNTETTGDRALYAQPV